MVAAHARPGRFVPPRVNVSRIGSRVQIFDSVRPALGPWSLVRESSNGRTTASGAVYQGSNPCSELNGTCLQTARSSSGARRPLPVTRVQIPYGSQKPLGCRGLFCIFDGVSTDGLRTGAKADCAMRLGVRTQMVYLRRRAGEPPDFEDGRQRDEPVHHCGCEVRCLVSDVRLSND